jgi:sialate O-acetylesterase
MRKMRNFLLPLIALLPFCVVAADLEFASPFTSGMVLQRDAPIVIRGHATADSKVTISLGSQKRAGDVAADGRWSVTFEAMPAGGPYAMSASDGSAEVKIDDLLVGDVWLCSGQSNMQMGLDETDGGPEAIKSATTEMPVRVLSVPKAGAETPEDKLDTKWSHCTPDSLRKFSAVAWFFGKHLRQDPKLANVPLGLIDSSFGGTAIEGWTPAGTLPDIPKDRLSGSMFGIPPAHLFNGMIAPLLACRIKGVVWYQGESNAGAPEVYSSLLQNMMNQWRQGWRQPELPFLIVQLPAFEGRMGGLDFGWLREAEADACRRTENAWLAVTYDTTKGFNLHPREKEEIGRRLSLLARRDVYGEEILAQGPQFKKVEIAGDRAVVTFDQELTVPAGEPVRGFTLAGADGDYRYANATIEGTQVQLTANGISEPESVRFAWGAMPDANLINQAGLPAVPFRTDDQKPDTLAFQPLPTVYRIEAQAYALETGRNGSVASLVVGGRQFLSHEPGGGTSIPGIFGPRNLSDTAMVGPRRLALSDDSAKLEIAAADKGMTWTLTNRGNDPIELRIALAPQVGVKSDGTAAELSRDGTKLRIEGIARVDDGSKLIAKAPAHGSAEIHWTIPAR